MCYLYEDKNASFWQSEIRESKGNSSKLWRTFKGILDNAPSAESNTHTANDSAVFFKEKSTLFKHLPPRRNCTMPHGTTPTMMEWSTGSDDEV